VVVGSGGAATAYDTNSTSVNNGGNSAARLFKYGS
jgi:hypothetical protein